MEILVRTGSILERHLAENARAKADEQQAIMDYNIMMGNLEDPNEGEETEEENG